MLRTLRICVWDGWDQKGGVICKFNYGIGAVCGCAIVGEQFIQPGAKDTTLGNTCIECQCGEDDTADQCYLWSACQEVQDPVTQGGTDVQITKVHDKPGWNHSIESGGINDEQHLYVHIFLNLC